MMLYTKDMELRNGINCIEPISNNKTKRSEAFFMPCDFQSKQKWKFEKSSFVRTGDQNGYRLLHLIRPPLPK